MVKRLVLLAGCVVALCAFAGCAAPPPDRSGLAVCASNPGGYDCQIERYQRAPG
jgi:hypothetical protein